MTSKERVLKSISHQEPDRIPIDIGQSAVTGISQIAYRNLLNLIGKGNRDINIFDVIQQLAEVDEDILEMFGVDMRGIYFGEPENWTLKIEDAGDYTSFVDAWDVIWRKPKKNGFYYDMYKHPLRGDNLEDIDRIKVLNPIDGKRVKPLLENAKRIYEKNEHFVMLGQCAYTVGYLQQFQWLQGFEDSYMNIAGNEMFTMKLLDKLEELETQFWNWFLPIAGSFIDMIIMADDYAGQLAMLISPKHFRKYFKPRYVQLFSKIKQMAPHMKIFFHSCGAIFEIIPDIIEMGVDVLNPIQFTAQGMDLKEIKKNFGENLTFWGGAVDTQYTLPRGTVHEVKDEIKRNLDILMPGGGYIFNTVHDIQADVPPENIIAMWEAVKEFGTY